MIDKPCYFTEANYREELDGIWTIYLFCTQCCHIRIHQEYALNPYEAVIQAEEDVRAGCEYRNVSEIPVAFG